VDDRLDRMDDRLDRMEERLEQMAERLERRQGRQSTLAHPPQARGPGSDSDTPERPGS
jgi:hypothetical protein